jgi:hypothetical protein
LKIKTSQPFPFFPCLKIEDASPARFKTKFSKKYVSHRNGLFQFPVIISFTFSRRSTQIPTTLILYTMATPTHFFLLQFSSFFTSQQQASNNNQQQTSQQQATIITTTGNTHPSSFTRTTGTTGIIVGITAATRKQW